MAKRKTKTAQVGASPKVSRSPQELKPTPNRTHYPATVQCWNCKHKNKLDILLGTEVDTHLRDRVSSCENCDMRLTDHCEIV